MKIRILFLLIIFNTGILFSQSRKYLIFDLSGVNGVGAISFDSRFNENNKFGYKIGVGYGTEFHSDQQHFYFTPVKVYMPVNNLQYHSISIPAHLYYQVGSSNNFFEPGIGLCAVYTNYTHRAGNGIGYFSYAHIAYRHESSNIPLMFSLGFELPFYTPGAAIGYGVGLTAFVNVGFKL